MEINNVGRINTTGSNQLKNNIKDETPKTQNNKKDNKKLILALGGLAIAGVATFAILKKRGGISLEKFKEAGSFKNGAASYNGKPFTGRINIIKDGSKKVIQYKDGKLFSAINSDGTIKKYNYDEIGKLISVDKFSADKARKLISSAPIAEIKETVQKDQAALKDLLKNQQNLSAEEFKRKADGIKYINSYNKKEIADTIKHKSEIEKIAKQRTQDEQLAKIKVKNSQKLYNQQFEGKLSHKSAEDSAKTFEKAHKLVQDSAPHSTEIKEVAKQKTPDEILSRGKIETTKETPLVEKLSEKKATQSSSAIPAKGKANSTIETKVDDKGTVIGRKIKTKKGITTIENLGENGEVQERITTIPHGRPTGEGTFYKGESTINTQYNNGSKLVFRESADELAEESATKIYSLDGKKPKLKFRETRYGYGNEDGLTRKTVEHFGDHSRTTLLDRQGNEKVIIRDKKGNILDTIINNNGANYTPPTADVSVLADFGPSKENWYKDYEELCKRYGEKIRPVGVTGGALDHFAELQRIKNGTIGDYLENTIGRNFANDPKARLLNLLRSEDSTISGEMSENFIKQAYDGIKNSIYNQGNISQLSEFA